MLNERGKGMVVDTTPEAARTRWEVLAGLSGQERLRQALQLSDFVIRVSASGRRDREQAPHRDAEKEPRR